MARALCEKIKYQICNAQNRRSYETDNHIFETNKNYFMPHGKYVSKKSSDMAMETMCAYTP